MKKAETFEQFITETPNVKIFVYENIDYSISKFIPDGFKVKAVKETYTDEIHKYAEAKSIDELYKKLKKLNFKGQIILSIS